MFGPGRARRNLARPDRPPSTPAPPTVLQRPAPPRRARALTASLAIAAALPWPAAHAQWIGAAGEDALVLRRGIVRVTVDGRVEDYDERFTSDASGATASARVPLGAPLSSAALGVDRVPSLAPVQTRLRSLTGTPAFLLSLGDVRVDAVARRSSIPVRFDL